MTKKQGAKLAIRSFWMVIPMLIFVAMNDFILHWSSYYVMVVYLTFGLIALALGKENTFKEISSVVFLLILLLMMVIVRYWPSVEAENGTRNLSAMATLCFIGWYNLPRFSMLLLQQIDQANNPQPPLNLKDDESS